MDPNWGRTLIRVWHWFLSRSFFLIESGLISPTVGFTQFYNLFFWGVCAEIVLYGTNVVSRVFLPLYYMKLVIYAYTLYYLISNYRKSYKIFLCAAVICCCFQWIILRFL